MPRWFYDICSKGLDWMAERQQRQTIRALQRLDRRMLADIGLDPREIETIARGDCLRGRGRVRRRAVIAKSSLGIMAAVPRTLSRPAPRALTALLTRHAA
jgi:hypothetical protein